MTATVEVSLLEQHPLSAAFPSMPENEFGALVLDIEVHGQREPGVLLDGMVLDGWNRYLACERLGVTFKANDFDGDDPRSFVISRNLHRRHMTAAQRVAAVAMCAEWAPSHRPENKGGTTSPLMTNARLAEAADASVKTVKQVKAAIRAGLGDAVKEGQVSAQDAALLAKGESPAPKPKAKPAGDAEKLEARMKEMADELVDLRESLAEMTLLAESAKAFEEKDEFKEMQVLRLELKSCKRRRDELMAENAALKKDVIRWRKKVIGK